MNANGKKGSAGDIDLDDDEQVDRAVRKAVEAALSAHKAAGHYVVGWEDGKIVRYEAEDIPIFEENEAK